MNLQTSIDFILEKILGASYTETHVIVLMFLVVIVIMLFKRGKKR